MRKIVTREERERKSKINQLILGMILILVMVFGTIGFAFSDNEAEGGLEIVNYGGIDFIREIDYWSFNIQGYDFLTKHNPREVEDISYLSYSSLQNYNGMPLYYAGETGEGLLEIERNLGGRFALRVSNACIDGKNCEGDYPVKNCSEDNIVVVDVGEKEQIYEEENCVFIFASYQNQTRYVDAFLFNLLGIK